MNEATAIAAGALSGGVMSWIVGLAQEKRARRDRLADARLELVRRLVRDKRGTEELARALNEVPVLFGGDDRAMRLHRASASAAQDRVDMEKVLDLLMHLCSEVGPSAVCRDDIARDT